MVNDSEFFGGSGGGGGLTPIEGQENELSVELSNGTQNIPLGFTPTDINKVYFQLLNQHQSNYPENIYVSIQPICKLSTEHTAETPIGNNRKARFKLNTDNEVEVSSNGSDETVVFRVWEVA